MQITTEQALQRGVTEQKRGNLREAESIYRSILQVDPDNSVTLYNLGITLNLLGEVERAIESFRHALRQKPHIAVLHFQLGIALEKVERTEEAEYCFKSAIALEPNHSQALNNLGIIQKKSRRLEEARSSFIRCLECDQGSYKAASNLCNTLRELGRLNEAEAYGRQAIALRPDFADAHNALGNTLKELGRLDDAIVSYKQALTLKPDFVEAYSNLGSAFLEIGNLNDAEASLKKAIALDPNYAQAHHNLSFTLLKSGKLKEGLNEYEWRWKVARNLSTKRHFPQPLWDGQKSLQGKRILLWSEQGIGDTLNWASCLPLVDSLAEHTILECQDKIVSLLSRSFPNIEVKPEDRSMDSKRDDFDLHLPMGSLYRHFFTHISQNSNADAYLIPNPVRVKFWRDRLASLGKGPYIGISWKSSKVSTFRLMHYPPISTWSSVLAVPDVTFINLQYSDSAGDLVDIKNDVGVTVHNFDDLDQYNDVDDVVALCAALDMVVSTKVTPLIFSSGVGTPTKVANWRQSTWNSVLFNPVCSSIDIYHRDTREPWDNVFQSIAEDIKKMSRKATENSEEILKN